jgi:LSD1 subclass zinc finger protein
MDGQYVPKKEMKCPNCKTKLKYVKGSKDAKSIQLVCEKCGFKREYQFRY